MKQVSDGRKVDILDLQKQLLDSEREKGELQKTQGDMESRLQAAVEELKNVKEREQRAIEEYRQQLGLPPMP
jgi:predicted  nucleic acid-binding Zn-ribbon protein